MASGIAETAKLIASLGFKDNFTPGAKKAMASLGQLETTGYRVGQQVGKGVSNAATNLKRLGLVAGTVAVGGIAAAAHAAIDWQDAFQGVIKTVDESDLKKAGLTFDQLGDKIRKMSLEMPNSAIELAGIAEQAGALGVKAGDIESFTKQVAILASTTNVTADDAATALGQLQNVIGLTGKDFDNFTAALVDLGNKGASTEASILEIERRSGGAAKLIGVAKDATLGWAAAAANLGINEELAGTSLQNFFLKTQNVVAGGGRSLTKFSKVAGLTAASFKKAFSKDASGTLERFVKGLQKLPKAQRLKTIQQFFGKGSGLTRLLTGLADSVDKNLTPSLDTATKAWKDNTAAQIEFDKRNQTIKSAFARLKNNVTDAAVSLGEGLAPALGRAADKLSDFLKIPENRQSLMKLGDDIGRLIDGIDWKALLDNVKSLSGAFKVASGFAKVMWDAFSAMPPEVKGLLLGLVGLNKLTGGAVTGIVGELGKGLIKGVLGMNAGVVNINAGVVNGAGGLGGAAAAGAAGFAGAGLMTAIGAIAIPAALAYVQSQFIQPGLQNQANGNTQRASDIVARGNLAEMTRALDGLKALPDSLNPLERSLYELNANGVKVHTETLKAELERAIAGAKIDANPGGPDDRSTSTSFKRIADAVDARGDRDRTLAGAVGDVKSSTDTWGAKNADAAAAVAATVALGASGQMAAVNGAKAAQVAASYAAAGIVAGAVRANPPPIVNVDVSVTPAQIQKTTTIVNRYGPQQGSAGGGAFGGH